MRFFYLGYSGVCVSLVVVFVGVIVCDYYQIVCVFFYLFVIPLCLTFRDNHRDLIQRNTNRCCHRCTTRKITRLNSWINRLVVMNTLVPLKSLTRGPMDHPTAPVLMARRAIAPPVSQSQLGLP